MHDEPALALNAVHGSAGSGLPLHTTVVVVPDVVVVVDLMPLQFLLDLSGTYFRVSNFIRSNLLEQSLKMNSLFMQETI